MENKKIIEWLKWMHSTLEVLEYKVQACHWNEVWSWFLYFHSRLWEFYEEVEENEDIVAERLRWIWWNTNLNLRSVVKYSIIKEKESIVWIKESIKDLLNDLTLVEFTFENFSKELWNDLITQQIVLDVIIMISKRKYLFSSEFWKI